MKAAAVIAMVAFAGCNAVLDNDAGHLVDVEATPDAAPSVQPVVTSIVDAAVDAGPACSNDLSNVGSGDFRIAFTVTTAASGPTALVNQRALCGHGYFWDVRLGDGRASGRIDIQTDDGVNFNEVATVLEVNDGQPHAVVVTRQAGSLGVMLDGKTAQLTVMSSAQPSELPALPPLRQGVDVCESVDGTARVKGALSGVCAGPK